MFEILKRYSISGKILHKIHEKKLPQNSVSGGKSHFFHLCASFGNLNRMPTITGECDIARLQTVIAFANRIRDYCRAVGISIAHWSLTFFLSPTTPDTLPPGGAAELMYRWSIVLQIFSSCWVRTTHTASPTILPVGFGFLPEYFWISSWIFLNFFLNFGFLLKGGTVM